MKGEVVKGHVVPDDGYYDHELVPRDPKTLSPLGPSLALKKPQPASATPGQPAAEEPGAQEAQAQAKAEAAAAPAPAAELEPKPAAAKAAPKKKPPKK